MAKPQHYNLIWRWHFYAGLIVLPVVLVLAVTGGLYLFQQEIENILYRDLLYTGSAQKNETHHENTVDHDAVIFAAKKTVAEKFASNEVRITNYQPPTTTNDTAQVVVATPAHGTLRVFVDPTTLATQGMLDESWRLMAIARQLHKGLMLGTPGRYITELVACWLIVLILSGLYLWWPRQLPGRGIIKPDTSNNGQPLWREFHAVSGAWCSLWILALLLSGLPWTVFWGGLLDKVAGQEALPAAIFRARPQSRSDANLTEVSMNTLVQRVHEAGMHHGFTIDYPWADNGTYAVMPLRHCNLGDMRYLFIDRRDGKLIDSYQWQDLGKVGRATSIGVAFHEGRLFGAWNQWLNLLAVLTVIFLCISGPVMWWKRKPANAFGAPSAPAKNLAMLPITVLLAIPGILMPLFGASLLLILCWETARKHCLAARR